MLKRNQFIIFPVLQGDTLLWSVRKTGEPLEQAKMVNTVFASNVTFNKAATDNSLVAEFFCHKVITSQQGQSIDKIGAKELVVENGRFIDKQYKVPLDFAETLYLDENREAWCAVKLQKPTTY
jgi:hypothetical protein